MAALLGNTNKSPIARDATGNVKVNSRFGEFSIDLSKAIYFPKGLFGFVPELHFSLMNFPKQEFEQFKILQCVNDENISLPVIPSGFDNPFIEPKDMAELLSVTEVKKEDFLLLFIASSVKKPNGNYEVFVNTKAPIVIDTKLQMGVQHVFTNNKYSVRQAV